MKSLKTIQVLFKIAAVISKILFVCCIVGFCLCVCGIVSLALGAPTFKLGGVTIESFLTDRAGLSDGTLIAYLAAGLVFCVGTAVLAKLAQRCFDREQQAGTPFDSTFAGALQTLGILTICIPIGEQIAAQIVHSILEKALPDVAALELDPIGSVMLGVMLIVMAQICKYGAELHDTIPQEA